LTGGERKVQTSTQLDAVFMGNSHGAYLSCNRRLVTYSCSIRFTGTAGGEAQYRETTM
jgi:hypothetical protein